MNPPGNNEPPCFPPQNKAASPLILITNDDGIHSPGLRAVVESLYDLGDLLICAPQTQQTGMSRSFPRLLGVGAMRRVAFTCGEKTLTGYGVVGSPAFAVAHGVLELAHKKPDLCVSGINYGENLGLTVSCSGTVGAAKEAFSHGVPGLAVSLQTRLDYQHKDDYPPVDWAYAKETTRRWAKKILAQGLPNNVSLLNVNVPSRPTSNEQRLTRLCPQNYVEFVKPPKRDLEEAYPLKSRLHVDKTNLEANSDIYAVHVDGVTSITPLTWDTSVEVGDLTK